MGTESQITGVVIFCSQMDFTLGVCEDGLMRVAFRLFCGSRYPLLSAPAFLIGKVGVIIRGTYHLQSRKSCMLGVILI